MVRFIIPLGAILMTLMLLYQGLNSGPHETPSPLIGKPAPAFMLPQLHQPDKKFSPQDMLGQVWLLNVWASWCVACKEEHAVLLALVQQNVVLWPGLHGCEAWLANSGTPCILSVSDAEGSIGNNYGVSGVPETYVMDKQGIIRHKQIGAITSQDLKEKTLPLIAELQNLK